MLPIDALGLEFFLGKFPDAGSLKMSNTFAWTCPYCDRNATISEHNYSVYLNGYDKNNKDGLLAIETLLVTCPNAICREYTIIVSLSKGEYFNGRVRSEGDALLTWNLKPSSSAKPLPTYIPKPVADDYNEACLIRDLSPKASATLSRRCLQGMIRDFWQVTKATLYLEIEAIKDKVDPEAWEAVDAVRSIGNIGAHMEKDISIIIDVDPKEAQLLIELIETLIDEWYVARHQRQERMRALKATADAKKVAPTKP